MTTRDDIIRRGYVDVKVYAAGIRQSHRLMVVGEKSAHGEIPFLVSKNYIPSAELVRIANECQLPVRHKDTVIFPKGMAPKDFGAKKPATLARVEAETVEAEIED